MDPVTQGLLGAAAAQVLLGRRLGRRAWLYGAVGGMAADLDVLIRSSDDPLVALRYHRHFTHSLAFVPVGGVLSALPWVLRTRFAEHRRSIVLGTTAGYATHALLDAFTSYGTMLWWPLSQARVAWNAVAIVDPIYTGILAVGVILSARWAGRGRPATPARLALLVSSLYLALGLVQRHRALEATRALAQARGHAVERIEAFPSPPVDFLWRTTYVSDGRVHVDRVRTPWWSAAEATAGESIPLVTAADVPAAIREHPRTWEAFETYRWFTDGWLAWEPEHEQVLGDLRYGRDLAGVESMWGLRLRPAEPEPVTSYRADMGSRLSERWDLLLGRE